MELFYYATKGIQCEDIHYYVKFRFLCMILIENFKKNPCRFAGESALRQLPVWVRPHVNKYDVFGRAIRDMIVFFKTAEQTVSFILINVYLLVIYFY